MSVAPDPRDPMLIDRHTHKELPAWVKAFRPHQWETVEQIVDAFSSGKKYVMLDAPTGAGKSLIAEVVRRRLGARAIYSCTTKTLQNQFAKDFEYAEVLKGRENYPTLNFADRFALEDPSLRITAADCNKRMKSTSLEDFENDLDYVDDTDDTSDKEEKAERVLVCDSCHTPDLCPYRIAKMKALRSSLVCMNTAYLMTECNGPAQFSSRFDLAICDEADLLENQLMSFVEVNVSSKMRRELGIAPPDIKTHTAARAYESWQKWCWYAAVRVKQRLSVLPLESPDVLVRRERKSLENLLKKLDKVAEEVVSGGWVYTGYTSAPDHPVAFRPVRVNKYAPGFLWRHAERWLLMSATMLSGDLTAKELGMEEGKYTLISMPSSFPKKNRPVYYMPAANMTNKLKVDERPKVVAALDKILDCYPLDKVLVHTISYDLTRYVVDNSKHSSRMVTYSNARERTEALKTFLRKESETRPPSSPVMVAPSMQRGLDLPDDLCRAVVVLKVPYPSLGDKQVSARLHSPGGQEWYHLQTIRSIVQMTGRGVRHDQDFSDTYILDSQFYKLWRKRKHWFPKWWSEAINWDAK